MKFQQIVIRKCAWKLEDDLEISSYDDKHLHQLLHSF